jgi:hypothetical protein
MLEDIDSLLSKRTDSLREQDAALKRLEAQVDELKTIMDVEVPPPVQQVYFTNDDPDEMVTFTLPDCISPVAETVCPYSSDSVHDLTDPYDSLHLSCEDDILQDSGLEPETIMDALVPPLVQQDEQPCQISSSTAYPWEADVWSDDEEIERIAWDAHRKAMLEKIGQAEEDMDFSESTGWLFEEEVVEEEDTTDLLEEAADGEAEFGDELVDLSAPEVDKDFDQVSPNKEDEKQAVVEEEEHHSRPVQALDITLLLVPPPWPPPREKAKRHLDRHRVRVRSCRDNKSPHYMPRIRFGPGKFKYWWPDQFKFDKIFLNSTNVILLNNMDRVELNGLDRVQIKEKPPD